MRQQRNKLLFGTNGTGKTTVMLTAAADYLEANYRHDKRVLCFIPDDGERKYDSIDEIPLEENALNNFTGIKKVYVNAEKDFGIIYDTYTKKTSLGLNGLAIFDDLGTIMNRRPENIIKCLRRRRQMNMDMIWNFHGLRTDIPPQFWGFATDIILFKTGGDYLDTMNKIDYDKRKAFEEMYHRVEDKAKINPYYYETLRLR